MKATEGKGIINKLNLFAYSNVYLALGVSSLAYASSILLIDSVNIFPLLIVFLMTFSMYTLNRKTDVTEDLVNHPERALFFQKFGKPLFILAAISYPLALGLSFRGGSWAFLPLLIVLAFGFLYSFPWIPRRMGKGYRRLKDITLLKNLTVAVASAVTCVLVPVFYGSLSLSVSVIVVFLFIVFRVFMNTISFDMRDLEGDKREGIKTIPVLVGVSKTKLLLYSLNIAVAIMVLISVLYGALPVLAYFLLLSSAYAHVYIYLFDKKNVNKDFLCDIVIDGETILIGIYILIGKVVLT